MVAVRSPLPWALVLSALGYVAIAPVSTARGYSVGPMSPAAQCFAASRAIVSALEAKLSPANGATVQAGEPATFSGYASVPVTFNVASSSSLLSSPDIDMGLGSAQSQPSGAPLYTFTSLKASANAVTVYWDASISTASVAECEGLTPTNDATEPRTLTVMPAPAAPQPAPAPAPAPPPPPLQVSIGALASFRLSHPTVTYTVDCTASCSGDTYYDVVAVRRHGRDVHVAKLDLGPVPVSITATAGGDERLTHRYRGSALRTLEGLPHAGDTIELQIDVKLTGTSGDVTEAHRTARITG